MAKGIASADLVVAGGKAGMLCSFGAGGLPPDATSAGLDKIQAALPNGPYAVNLIHSPFDDVLEQKNVEMFLKRGVRIVEASAFMKLTPHVVRYRVAGLERGSDGKVVCRNKIIFKVSRTELATLAMRSPPADMVAKLLAQGLVTAEQAELAKSVTMCDDVAVEADSGGHTDNRPLVVLLPIILATRDAIAKETGMRVRVGAGGGMGCPEAAASAFQMGADFVLTGTINQLCKQSGSCDRVRKALSEATYSDIAMAPAADMFDQGVQLQVLKKGTMFPSRAKKLWELFIAYPSLEAIPAQMMERLEKQTFKKTVAQIWAETRSFFIDRIGDPEKIERAERDPKLKMSLVFRWYLGQSSMWANRGVEDRALDYQVWCGPAIGSFNEFIKGTYLDPAVSGEFPDVVQANLQILKGTTVLRRCNEIRAHPRLSAEVPQSVTSKYVPLGPLQPTAGAPAVVPRTPARGSAAAAAALRRDLLELDRDVTVPLAGGAKGVVHSIPWESLGTGSAEFMALYGTKYPLYTGAMAKGIASADLVVAGGKAGMLCSFGAGGLPPDATSAGLDKIQAALPNGPYAVNLIHSPFDDVLEQKNVEMFLKRGVRIVEASAFMKLTPHVVRYRVAGLERGSDGKVVCRNKIIFKVSRTELATLAMRSPPADMVAKLLAQGLVTAEQAELAKSVTMCDDVAVEADSGGHTDNRPLVVLLPIILATRDAIAKETGMRVRVGAGGGMGCPEAAASAFQMGADFVLTGTINQLCKQSGSCDRVRKALSEATYSDIAMAPAADMFDQGVQLQVLKKGTMFPSRAKKLWELFIAYPSLEAIPAQMMERLEKQTFKKTVAQIWAETRSFFIDRIGDPEKIERAERDPKLKMSLVFRWYLGQSSMWANRGVEDRALDYQVWCGPAIGSFNEFIKGTYLDPAVSGEFPDVVQANLQLLRGARFVLRCNEIKADPALRSAVPEAALRAYRPDKAL